MMGDRWSSPSLDAVAFADILGITAGSLRQKLVKDNGVPAPDTKGANGRNLWAPAVVYRYVREHHAGRRYRTPRLWTPGELNPARFLGALRIDLRPGRAGTREVYVVHCWQPSDEAGPIAVGYPLNTTRGRLAPQRAAEELFSQLSPRFTAVAVPTGESGVAAGVEGGVVEPVLAVVDTSTAGHPDGQAVVEYGWHVLAGLLNTDVPWWPRVLSDCEALMSWEPGVPVRPVAGAAGSVAVQPLTDLLTWIPGMAVEVRDAVARLADSIAGELAGDAVRETARYISRRGLVVAATPLPGPGSRPVARCRGDVAALLHQQVADPMLAERAVAAAEGQPVVTGIMVIGPEQRGDPLAAAWLDGLYSVEPQQRSELGFRLLDRLRPDEPDRAMTSVVQWCAHEGDPDVWAVITGDGTVYTTVGSSVPAGGVLREAAVTASAGFFRDSAGAVWPLPRGRDRIYSCGYAGRQPRTLAAVLTRLMQDAGADVADIDPTDHPVDPLVWDSVHRRHFPLHIEGPHTITLHCGG